MAKRLQHRGGTTSQHSTFTGAVREVTVDTDKNTLVVHDGSTAGGHPLATATNFTSTGIDDNATSTAITIDSSERIGIGTSSQEVPLSVVGLDTQIHFGEASDGGGYLMSESDGQFRISGGAAFKVGGTPWIAKATEAAIIGHDSGGDIKFFNNTGLTVGTSFTPSERMRINSDGRLLVGTTTTTPGTTTGVRLYEDGTGFFTVDGNYVGYFNRLTSDGDIALFRKDGTTVGTIGAYGGRTILASGNTGLRLDGTADAIVPRTSSNGLRANTIDLGDSTNTFKDLYLGGGLYVGGTAAANKLDDYEEGTWTPTASSGVTAVTGSAKYRKVGSLVYVQAYLTGIAGKSASNLILGGLPFSTQTDGYGIGIIEGGSTSGKMGIARPDSAGTLINFYYPDTSTVERTIYTGNDVGNFIILSLTYHVA